MSVKWFPIREGDLPYDDLDGKRVKFELISNQRNEGHVSGTGKFNLIPGINGLVRLEIQCDLRDGSLLRVPMRPVFLISIKRNQPGSETDFCLNFRR
jgi:hypothetical protein